MESINLNPDKTPSQSPSVNPVSANPVAQVTPPAVTADSGSVDGNSGNLPGFFTIFKISLILFGKNWLKFIKLLLIWLIPVFLIGGAFYFVGKAKAAPKLPSNTTISETVNTSETGSGSENIPATNGSEGIEDQTGTADSSGTSETASPEEGLGTTNELKDNLPQTTNVTEITDTQTGSVDSTVKNDKESGTVVSDEEIRKDVEAAMESARLQAKFNPAMIMMSLAFSLSSFGLVPLLIIGLVLLFYYLAATLSFTKLSVLLAQNEEIDMGGIMKWSFRNVFRFIWLSLINMVYVGWPSLLMIPIQIMNINLGIFNILLIIAILAFGAFNTMKIIFDKFILAEGNSTSMEAFRASIHEAKGNWWMIFLYVIGFVLIIFITTFVISYLLGLIHSIAGIIAKPILSMVGGLLTLFFYYSLYNLCKMKNARKAA